MFSVHRRNFTVWSQHIYVEERHEENYPPVVFGVKCILFQQRET